MDEFRSLGLSEPLASALASFGFQAPTPVQVATIPLVLERRDAFVQSETGTGKTFAYLAPAMQEAVAEIRKSADPIIIVAAPTQELAVQIGREAERLAAAAGLDLKIAVVLGGTTLDKQIAKLRERPQLVVGTLGRISDLLSLGKLRSSGLRYLILDEADRLMSNETSAQALGLVKAAPRACSRIFVSATLPERIRREFRPLLVDPAEISVQGDPVLAGSIEHWCFYCDSRKRLDFLRRLEAALRPQRCLVFISQASRVPGSAERLAAYGLPVAAIHASMEKETRRVALERFAKGEVRYLVTSDLGARGLDIPAVSHVVSLDLPEEYTIYTHRAGRTGRAGATGISVVLADGVELARASKIAVRGGFVFRCKVLQSGLLLEPSTDEFFAAAAAAEEERLAAKASLYEPRERRGGRAAAERGVPRPRAEGGPGSRPEERRAAPSHGRAPHDSGRPQAPEAPGRGPGDRGPWGRTPSHAPDVRRPNRPPDDQRQRYKPDDRGRGGNRPGERPPDGQRQRYKPDDHGRVGSRPGERPPDGQRQRYKQGGRGPMPGGTGRRPTKP